MLIDRRPEGVNRAMCKVPERVEMPQGWHASSWLKRFAAAMSPVAMLLIIRLTSPRVFSRLMRPENSLGGSSASNTLQPPYWYDRARSSENSASTDGPDACRPRRRACSSKRLMAASSSDGLVKITGWPGSEVRVG